MHTARAYHGVDIALIELILVRLPGFPSQVSIECHLLQGLHHSGIVHVLREPGKRARQTNLPNRPIRLLVPMATGAGTDPCAVLVSGVPLGRQASTRSA